MDLSTLTTIHTGLSLIALAAGVPVIASLLHGRIATAWTGVFLWTAVATSVTGFIFPFNGFLPSHGVGVIALAVLVPTLAGLYLFGLRDNWRRIYAAGAVASEYFLVFVAVAQAFQKVPALRALAPTQAEPPFAIAQAIVLVVFLWLGWRVLRAARPAIVTRRVPR
ncbi:hypothetical protein EDC65_1214 [Stella humosa]|uniref:Uncharacterized protein n=1 Tax=Stella humosa TaxID=94 RepID=A0A3N1MM04_9PROT|nr:hypothetical protein [Stella humosa]ROQ02026.1 hypothetical protein EDC65_1214 [Stella humosa]BBK32416.1 hypothetical protein STHU_30500 [Stella humosa]